MKLTKKQREEVRMKYGGRCAYSGTPLDDDWQVDHVVPIVRNWWDGTCVFPEAHDMDNLVPCQRVINKYKGSLPLETFRGWLLESLHERLAKLPKNPKSEKGIRRKKFLLAVAGYFGITADKPFSGKFYFETHKINIIKEALKQEDER